MRGGTVAIRLSLFVVADDECHLSASPDSQQRLAARRKRPGSQHGEVEGTSSKRLRESGEVAVAMLSVFIADATDRQCVYNC